MIRIVADVHGAAAALRKVAAEPGPLLVLGDLINFIDYRNFDGIVCDVMGRDTVRDMVEKRSRGDYAAARAVWDAVSRGREAELRRAYAERITASYGEMCDALAGSDAYVTFGNADRPDLLEQMLPDSARFVDGVTVEIGGVGFGFAGGGTKSPLGVPGEVDDGDMAAKLDALGPVDILCTHVPPAVPQLSQDVIGGREKGSEPILEYLLRHRPRHHYFGDIHQPQATTWRVGSTTCVNVGYFRATGRAVVHA